MRRFWAFRAADGTPATGELLLYGPIAPDDGLSWLFDEMTPRQFKTDLDALGEIAELRVMINSGGGDVFAGQAIHSMLTRHPAHVTVYVDGLAASIASIVAMAGDTVVMPRNAMMMVHNPWTFAIGDAREFREQAEILDRVRESMIAAYEAKTGIERPRLINLLNAETWMTAEEAVELGFADQIEQAAPAASAPVGLVGASNGFHPQGRQAVPITASLVRPGLLRIGGEQTVEIDLGRYQHPPEFPLSPTLPPQVGGSDTRLRDAGAPELTERTAERALRDAGFSRERAKAIVARGWEPPTPSPQPAQALSLYLEYQRTLAGILAA